jgi:hypothetical protein
MPSLGSRVSEFWFAGARRSSAQKFLAIGSLRFFVAQKAAAQDRNGLPCMASGDVGRKAKAREAEGEASHRFAGWRETIMLGLAFQQVVRASGPRGRENLKDADREETNGCAGKAARRCSVRGLLLAVVAMASTALLGCGVGSGAHPPPPSGPFSNASLHGQYAYSMNGVDPTGAFIARVGTFTADGSGNITGGLVDVLNLSTGQPASLISITSGSYLVGQNGTGSVDLEAASGTALQLSVAMQTTSTGFVIQSDLNATSSGTFALQTSADFSAAALGHAFVFDVYGVSFGAASVAPISMIGEAAGDGNGNITGGVMDTNDGNLTAPSGATEIAPGTYALDTNGNGSNFGRGQMTFNGRTFVFYIVDSTHFKLLEEDALGGSVGDALQQSAAVPTENAQFNGSFVYLVTGFSRLGSEGPVARVARFTADGNGNLGGISLDDNNDGGYTHVSQGGNISAATYAMDTTNAGSGRATFTFKDSNAGTFSDVMYLISATQAAVQETSKGIIGTGPLEAQTGGPFTLSGSAGMYISNWNGVQLGSSTAVPYEENYVNQYALSSVNSSNIAGTADYVELGLSQKNMYSNVGLGGTLTIKNDGTVNNLYRFALNGSPSITVNFQAYFVNPGTVFMICSDSNRTTSGIVSQQPTE